MSILKCCNSNCGGVFATIRADDYEKHAAAPDVFSWLQKLRLLQNKWVMSKGSREFNEEKQPGQRAQK